MTALSANLQPLAWAHGFIKSTNRAANSSYANGAHGWLGSMTMSVDGVARPVVSGASMAALCTTIPGADANGGVVLSARQAAVTVQFAAGATKTLSVTSITYGATIAILIQQGTDGGGATTNTAEQMCNLIRSNGELDQLLRCKATGTGAGLTATATATAIKFVTMLGVAQYEYNALAGALTLNVCDGFQVGQWGAIPDTATPPVLNSVAYIIDDATVSGTADPLSFKAPFGLLDSRGQAYVNLQEAR